MHNLVIKKHPEKSAAMLLLKLTTNQHIVSLLSYISSQYKVLIMFNVLNFFQKSFLRYGFYVRAC